MAQILRVDADALREIVRAPLQVVLLLRRPLDVATRSSSSISARARVKPLGVVLLLDRRASAGRCPRRMPPSASRLVMRSSITWPTEPSCSRMVSVFRTSASSTMSASRCS